MSKAHLEVTADEEQVDLEPLRLLGTRNGRIDGVKLAVAAALDGDLAMRACGGQEMSKEDERGRRAHVHGWLKQR